MEKLGPFGDLTHRKACMLEAMRVLAGFESSWKWNTGKDTQNPNENSADTDSSGPYQVSANSMAFGQDLRKPEQSILPWISRDAVAEFQQMLG